MRPDYDEFFKTVSFVAVLNRVAPVIVAGLAITFVWFVGIPLFRLFVLGV